MTQAENCTEIIRSRVAGIRRIVSQRSTMALAGQCLAFNLRRGQPGAAPDNSLIAPARQCSFLLGLTLATPEPAQDQDLGLHDWENLQSLLNYAFGAYFRLFLPEQGLPGAMPEEWLRVRDVALPAFLQFLGGSLLASAEQIGSRVKRYLVPFDEELRRKWSLSVSEALTVADWAANRMQAHADELSVAGREERGARHELLQRAKDAGWSVEQIRKAAREEPYSQRLERFLSLLRRFGCVSRTDMLAVFPRVGAAFWEQFSVKRGEGPLLEFPTERSICDERPLIQLDADVAIVPLVNTMYSAILEVGERELSNGPIRARFFETRDRILEDEVSSHLKALLGGSATVYRNVFETPDRRFEHDLVGMTSRLLIVAESKASPPIEPFRDPERAYPRLRDAFRSDTGIQKAFDQGNHLLQRLRRGEAVTLYDRHGAVVDIIPATASAYAFGLCVTRDNHGPIATDLALLLQKATGDPYPWAVGVLDLEALAEAWGMLGWADAEFRNYLRYRVQLHGKVFSDDELVFAGYFLRHGSLRTAHEAPGDLLALNPTYSDIFDEIYHHLHQGGERPAIEPKPPVTADLRRSFEKGLSIFLNREGREVEPKRGRNARCDCGSGKKVKKCCGRRT